MPPANITSSRVWKEWIGTTLTAQFTIKNYVEYPLNITISYIIAGSQKEVSVVLDPLGSYTVTDYYDQANPSGFDANNIRIKYNNAIVASENVNKQNVVCKECPLNSGLICINDGQPADTDNRCGSEKRISGICQSKFVKGDSICSSELFNENCGNSKLDCACSDNQKCENEECVINPLDPPEGKGYCNGVFKNTQSISLNNNCDCDFECKEGVCLNNKCQYILSPKLTCKSGTDVKKGDELYCNLVATNTLLNNDVKATLVLDAGNGLAFSASDGCQNVKGSQCIGNFMISDLSNDGVEVKLQALAGGNSKISGVVSFPYKGITIKEIVSDLNTHVYFCGDGKVDLGETKDNCCSDTGVSEYNFYNLNNERCESNTFTEPFNWKFTLTILLILVTFGLVTLFLLNNKKGDK
jgi:hypothetical protein